jgi:hypothetical protein
MGGKMKKSILLKIDGLVNVVLGVFLMSFPSNLAKMLGIPIPQCTFYPNILGAVLFGVGLALFFERYRGVFGSTGLGIGGAICINVCGAAMLLTWVLGGKLDIPLRGYIILSLVCLLILVISIFEVFFVFTRKQNDHKNTNTC